MMGLFGNSKELTAQLVETQNQRHSAQAMIDAMASAMALVEFSPDGHIINANHKFLNIMGYDAAHILGKHHSILCHQKTASSPEYKTFWRNLAQGQACSGEYSRLAKGGKRLVDLA